MNVARPSWSASDKLASQKRDTVNDVLVNGQNVFIIDDSARPQETPRLLRIRSVAPSGGVANPVQIQCVQSFRDNTEVVRFTLPPGSTREHRYYGSMRALGDQLDGLDATVQAEIVEGDVQYVPPPFEDDFSRVGGAGVPGAFSTVSPPGFPPNGRLQVWLSNANGVSPAPGFTYRFVTQAGLVLAEWTVIGIMANPIPHPPKCHLQARNNDVAGATDRGTVVWL